MLSIELSGPPFERGFQHGQRLANNIRRTIEGFVPAGWRESAGVLELKRRLLATLAEEHPDIVTEMVGIGQGAGIAFDDVVLLNLVLATNDLSAPSIEGTFSLGCSAIGVVDPDLGPVVAKNCDECQAAAPYYLFQTVRPRRGLAFMGISWVGTAWLEGGLNEAGLAFMQTAGPFVPRQDGYGIACNIAPHIILATCETVCQAIEALKSMRVAGWGFGGVLADREGHLTVVEKSYDLFVARTAVSNVAFCCNHFVDPAFDVALPIPHEGLEENSKARHRTLQTLFGGRDWPRTAEGVRHALAYHGEAGFVCQHGDAGLHTNYSAVAYPRRRCVQVGDGYPCVSGDYTTFLFE